MWPEARPATPRSRRSPCPPRGLITFKAAHTSLLNPSSAIAIPTTRPNQAPVIVLPSSLNRASQYAGKRSSPPQIVSHIAVHFIHVVERVALGIVEARFDVFAFLSCAKLTTACRTGSIPLIRWPDCSMSTCWMRKNLPSIHSKVIRPTASPVIPHVPTNLSKPSRSGLGADVRVVYSARLSFDMIFTP